MTERIGGQKVGLTACALCAWLLGGTRGRERIGEEAGRGVERLTVA